MTYIRPCRRCNRRASCSRYEAARQMIRGATTVKVSSIVLKCRIPQTEDFPPGSRVRTAAFTLEYDGSGGIGRAEVDVEGTVVRWNGEKALVVLDSANDIQPEGNSHAISMLWRFPDQMTFLWEAAQKVCPCGKLTLERCVAAAYPITKSGATWECPEESQRIARAEKAAARMLTPNRDLDDDIPF